MKKNLFLTFIFLLNIAFTQTKYEDMEPEKLKEWLNDRVENAKFGLNETVEIPFVVRSLGWGCDCPYYFLGSSVGTLDGFWLSPISTNKLPKINKLGHRLVLTGYFTGKLITQKFEYGETVKNMPQFEIQKIKFLKPNEDAPAPKIVSTNKSIGKKSTKKMNYPELLGTWKTGIPGKTPVSRFTFTFKTNNIVIFEKLKKKTGTWKITNNHLHVDVNGFDPDFGEIISVSKTLIELKKDDKMTYLSKVKK